MIAHAWDGPNDHFNSLADNFAQKGFVGFAIDVYGKGKRGKIDGDNMTIIIETERLKYLEKLESLHRVFIGLKMLYACTMSSNEFEIHDPSFYLLNMETKKMIIGKLYILLSDEYKGYNTISFKILIKSMLEETGDNGNKCLENLLKEIEIIDEETYTILLATQLRRNTRLLEINFMRILNLRKIIP